MQNLVVLVLFSIEIMTVKAGHNWFATHNNAYKATDRKSETGESNFHMDSFILDAHFLSPLHQLEDNVIFYNSS